MATSIRLYYQRGRRKFEKVVIKHERREKFLIALFAGLGLVSTFFYLLTSWIERFRLHFRPRTRWFGAGLIFIVNLLFIWSHKVLGKNWSPFLEIRRGHTLVTEGPYRFIRHPMYASKFLIETGVSLLSANWMVALSYMLPANILYLVRLSDEEKMMREQFGDEYREYMKRTGRLIPKLSLLTRKMHGLSEKDR